MINKDEKISTRLDREKKWLYGVSWSDGDVGRFLYKIVE